MTTWRPRTWCDTRRRDAAAARRRRLLDRFVEASTEGDLAAIVRVLDDDATILIDGGGNALLPRGTAFGAHEVATALLGVRIAFPDAVLRVRDVNGEAGVVLDQGGSVVGIITLRVEGPTVRQVWVVVAPEKLASWNPMDE